MKLLIDLIEQNEINEGRILIHEMLRDIVSVKLRDISSKLIVAEASAPPPTADQTAGTLEDPLIDPNMAREYFYSRFTHGEHEVTLKRLGMGQNTPVVSYIDDTRYEIFTTTKQAEKETTRYIDDGSFAKAKKRKEEEEKKIAAAATPAPAAPAPEKNNESIEIMREVVEFKRPLVIEFNDGNSRVITTEEAENTLEIYNLLNTENKEKFTDKLNSSEEIYLEMISFLTDRLRKGII